MMTDYKLIYRDFLKFLLSTYPDYDVKPLLSDLYLTNVITEDERATITNRGSRLEKIYTLFVELMPCKDMSCQHELMKILKRNRQTGLANWLTDRIGDKNAQPSAKGTHPTNKQRRNEEKGHMSMALDTKSLSSTTTLNTSDQNQFRGVHVIQRCDLTEMTYIDRGSYGRVYSANFQKENRPVAIKVIQAAEHSEKNWRNEMELLQQINHPHIVSILGVVDNLKENELWIVTELMSSSLRPYCTGDKTDQLTDFQKLEIGTHCCSALCYLHTEANVIHKDIKPENILLRNMPRDRLEAKICDFGTAKIIDTSRPNLSSVAGTVMYLPPELASDQPVAHEKQDIYSLGATLVELFTNLWFWSSSIDSSPLKEKVMPLLLKIYEKVKADLPVNWNELSQSLRCQIATSIFESKNCDADVTVKNILMLAVRFRHEERPTASNMLEVFTKSLSSRNKDTITSEDLLEKFNAESSSHNEKHSPTQTVMRLDEITEKKYLDQGTYGKVFSCIYKNRRVAVKIFPADSSEKNSWEREADLLQQINHPYILSILGVVDNLVERELWIVTELMEAGSLRPYCTGKNHDQMTVTEKIAIGFQCWSALSYLHMEAITHKDIKPENILLSCSGGKLEARLSGFENAKLRDTVASTKTSMTGTVMYFPPELASGHLSPKKGDVYSLGATLIELFTNLWTWHDAMTFKPLQYMRVMLLLAKIDEKANASLEIKLNEIAPNSSDASSALDSNNCDPQVVNILKQTVNYDRHNRPYASDVATIFKSALPKVHVKHVTFL